MNTKDKYVFLDNHGNVHVAKYKKAHKLMNLSDNEESHDEKEDDVESVGSDFEEILAAASPIKVKDPAYEKALRHMMSKKHHINKPKKVEQKVKVIAAPKRPSRSVSHDQKKKKIASKPLIPIVVKDRVKRKSHSIDKKAPVLDVDQAKQGLTYYNPETYQEKWLQKQQDTPKKKPSFKDALKQHDEAEQLILKLQKEELMRKKKESMKAKQEEAYLPVFDTDMPRYDGLQNLAHKEEEYGQPAEKFWGFSVYQWLGIGAFLLLAIIYSIYVAFGQKEETKNERTRSTEKPMAAKNLDEIAEVSEANEDTVKESLL